MKPNKEKSYRELWNKMDGPGDDHAKWSKSDRERQTPYDMAYIRNLKKKQTRYKWTDLQNRNRLIDLENEFMVTGGEGLWGGGGIVRDFGINIHTLLYIK